MIKILLVIALIAALLLLGIWGISTKERLTAKKARLEKELQKTMLTMIDCHDIINNLTPGSIETKLIVTDVSRCLYNQERKATRLALQIHRIKTKLEKQ